MGKPPQPETTAATGKAQGSSADSGTEYVFIHHATGPAAQTANCILDAVSAWQCPRALSSTNETRASATMRWICWCLSHALCAGCQAAALRMLLHCVAETCCQPPQSICCWLCMEFEKGFLASPEVPLAQQERGVPHPLYCSAITS